MQQTEQRTQAPAETKQKATLRQMPMAASKSAFVDLPTRLCSSEGLIPKTED